MGNMNLQNSTIRPGIGNDKPNLEIRNEVLQDQVGVLLQEASSEFGILLTMYHYVSQ
jgi:hypothetical protein